MAISTITATDGTVRATTWVGLLYEMCLFGHHLQGRYNRAKPKAKKNIFSLDYKFDGETTTFTCAAILDGQRVMNATTGKPEFKLDTILSDYIVDAAGLPVPFDGGTGVLAGYTTFEDALLYVADMVSFYEAQIEPDLLLKEINVVNKTPTPEEGNETLSISLPLRNGWDESIGQSVITPKNYLFVLDVPDTEAI
ncbi:MAG: hypothetical protein HC778_00535 [Chamaesiphon sp. CSU_1_12]|nr:hypothetical protein [Chamaesiphon sp. CSU_1_12]